MRTAPEDWRAQTAEQKAAINQFHIARIAKHFRQNGARVKQHAEDLPPDRGMTMEPEAGVSAIVFHHPNCACFTAEEGENGAAAQAARKAPLVHTGPFPLRSTRFPNQLVQYG